MRACVTDETDMGIRASMQMQWTEQWLPLFNIRVMMQAAAKRASS